MAPKAYLKHHLRSGVPSMPFPTVTISPERKAFLTNTGKDLSISRMVVAHCRWEQLSRHHQTQSSSPLGAGHPTLASFPWELGPSLEHGQRPHWLGGGHGLGGRRQAFPHPALSQGKGCGGKVPEPLLHYS